MWETGVTLRRSTLAAGLALAGALAAPAGGTTTAVAPCSPAVRHDVLRTKNNKILWVRLVRAPVTHVLVSGPGPSYVDAPSAGTRSTCSTCRRRADRGSLARGMLRVFRRADRATKGCKGGAR